MKTANLKVWTNELRTTTLPQGGKVLVSRDENDHDVLRYCCLGIGCRIVPDSPSSLLDPEEEHGLPTLRFHNWIGSADVDLDHMDEVGGDAEYDLYPDWPVPRYEDRDGNVIDHSAAGMNDTLGLTFAQIADVFDYFGMKEVDLL